MRLPTRPQLLALLFACAAGAAVLIVLLIAASGIALVERGPADILPRDRTIAVFHRIDPETLVRASAWFPELAALNADVVGATVAVLRADDRTQELALFFDTGAVHEDDPATIGTYRIVASPMATALLSSANPLHSDAAYRHLEREYRRKEQWTFLDPRTIVIPVDAFDTLLNASLGLQEHAWSMDADAADRRRIFTTGTRGTSAAASPPRAPTDDTLLAVSFGAIDDTWKALESALTEEETLLLHGLLQQWTTERIGPDISFVYDVLPLLAGKAELRIARSTTNAPVRFAVQINGIDTKHLDVLDRFHAAAGHALPASRIDEISLDNNFTYRGIRQDADRILHSTETIDGWTVQRTSITPRSSQENAAVPFFGTALRGNSLVLATDSALLAELAWERDSSPLLTLPPDITPSGTTIGWANIRDLRSLLQPWRPPAIAGVDALEALVGDTTSLLWTTQRRGNDRIISLQVQPQE